MDNEKNVGMEAADTLEQVKDIVTEIREQLNSPLPAGGNLVGKVDVNTVPEALTDLMIKWTDLQESLEEIRKAVMDPGIAEFNADYMMYVPFLKAKEFNVPKGHVSYSAHGYGDYFIDKVYLLANDSENDIKLMMSSLNSHHSSYPDTQNITLHPGECLEDLDVKLSEVYINTQDPSVVGPSKMRFIYRCALRKKK